MKKLLLVLLMVGCLAGMTMAQVTPIHDIQYTEDESGDSPLAGQTVTVSGIITGEPGAFGSSYYIQDAEGPWNGIMVYDGGREVAEGDSVTLTADVSEYYNLTELSNVTEFTIEKEGVFGINPDTLTTAEASTEAYEGCLVTVENLTISNDNLGYGEWEVDDGSGPCVVDNVADYYFDPTTATEVASITGLIGYDYGAYKIRPRLAFDVVEAGDYTRIQRIQQVRQSDLEKAPYDNESDISYLDGDTLKITGIVTMPTGLSYAGDGIKFIISEPEGGPWSAVLSYNADSTAYPQLFEGDEIEMTGYIGEYTTSPSNMTEFWITSPINILSIGNELPEPDSIATGDLRWPTTAEQWGNVIVQVGNAVVDNVTPQYELFSVNDGTGSVLVDDDSDSLANYEDPPLGAIAEYLSGWVYHHYGSYADSTAYKLEPLYVGDIVWGAGPPSVKNTVRSVAAPTTQDDVDVTTEVQTNLTITQATLSYNVDDGDYTDVAMTDNGDGTWTGTIPAQAEGAYVSYYVAASDDAEQSTTDPAEPTRLNYSYKVTDAALTIADLQNTPWEIADSPYNGYEVEVSGYVTAGDAFLGIYEGFVIQDMTGEWNGVYVFDQTADGVSLPSLNVGDWVTVYGTVSDYNPDYHYKWDNNTVILADSAVVALSKSDSEMPEPVVVNTGELADDADTAEQWEGVLTRVENVTISSVNSYDFSVTDGSGECRIDDDGVEDAVLLINRDDEYVVVNNTDTLRVGDVISGIQGVFTFSFGTFKIEVRDVNDMGVTTGVNDDFVAAPLAYNLGQNYPNPFNPETRIYFTLPHTQNTQIVIYNVMGQQVRTLVDQQYQAGQHVVNWNGLNNAGLKVPSGVYFYRIVAGDFVATKKMMMLK